MRPYAARTTVASSKTIWEIEKIVTRFGADRFAYTWVDEKNMAMIGFAMQGRMIRFLVPMPARDEYQKVRKGHKRDTQVAAKMWDQEVRRRWRSVLLMVKAKLEAMTSGIATFEDEFLAYIVLPDGSTVGESVQPQLAEAYGGGRGCPRLPCLDEPKRLEQR